MKRSDMDMIAQDMVCIAERADGKGKVEGYYFCLHHNDGRTHLHHLIIPLEADLSRGKPLDQIQAEVVPESITLKAHEPRVMTICEIQSFDGAVYVDEPKNPVCLKMLYCYEVGQRTYGHGYTFVDSDGDKVFYSAQGFGTKWRCWTARPTDEQRKAVPWE